MVPRQVVRTASVAGGALFALLIATGCSTPDAAPNPVTIPTITTSPQVSTTTPENNTISVQPTTIEPTVDATTEPPPETTTEPVPPPPEETEPPEEPERGPFVVQGASCDEEGALGESRRGKPLVCSSSARGRLRWQPL